MVARQATRLMAAIGWAALFVLGGAAEAQLPGTATTHTLRFQGRDRVYELYVPSGLDPQSPAPLVIDLHGFSLDPPGHDNISQSRALAQALADQGAESFIVAQPWGWDVDTCPAGVTPSGSCRSWNAGDCCPPASGRALLALPDVPALGLDDVGLARAIVDHVAGRHPIDRRRVYATGHSNGGAMAQRLACEANDRFAAVSSVAAPLFFEDVSVCQPARPMPVIHFAGFDDVVVPYEGGYTSALFPELRAPAAQENFAHWALVNGCKEPPACTDGKTDGFDASCSGGVCDDGLCQGTAGLEDTDGDACLEGNPGCETHAGCDGHAEVRLCSLRSVVQVHPDLSCDSVLTGLFSHLLYGGFNAEGLDVSAASWEFLRQFTLPVMCGDAIIDAGEACDDGNALAGDGCDGACRVEAEAGFRCQGEPSVCFLPVPVGGARLVVLDTLADSGTAKMSFVARDPAIGKGAGTDVSDIGVRLHLAYGNGAAAGAFVVPPGEAGWTVNTDTVARYVHRAAPAPPTQAKVALVAPQRRLRLVAKGLGEQPLDILGAGDPLGDVFSAYCVRNGGRETCHCSRFSSCAFSPAAGGTGAKLSCSDAAGDPDCTAAAPCAGVPAGTCVDGDGCCLVGCTPGSDDDCTKS